MRWICLMAVAGLMACAAPQSPTPPDQPECAKPEKAPVDGGLGGTGNTPTADCADE